MARRKNRYADSFLLWERIITSILANLAAFPHLEPLATKLRGFLEEARSLAADQVQQIAVKQDTSKRLLAVTVNGNKLATALQKVVTEHYGSRSEKVVEFGIQPFRGRRPAPDTQEPEEPQGPEVETLPVQPAPAVQTATE